MKRVLNGLQSTAMSSPVVNQSTVYLTCRAPLPSDVELISQSLFNDSFSTAYSKIVHLCTAKGYSMADILSELTDLVSLMKLPDGALGAILDGMSAVEHRLAFGTDETVQCAALVGVFVKARNAISVKKQ